MKRIAVAAVGLAALTSTPALAASDCVVGGSTVSPDSSAISVIFDAFEASPGDSAVCALSVPTGLALASGTFAVYSADYRGFVNEGDVARLLVTQDGATDEATIVGPRDGQLFRNFVGTGETENINSEIVLILADTPDPLSFAALDSIDYALAATTTLAELQASLDALADERQSELLHLQSLAALLTGANEPFLGADDVAIMGAVGSRLAGITTRQSLSSAVTFMGGAALFDEASEEEGVRGVLAAGALRYLPASETALRPFAEVGAGLSPLELRQSRRYLDGTRDGASGAIETDGLFANVYAEAGLLYLPEGGSELAVSGTVVQNWFRTEAVSEEFGESNLFAARFEEETTAVVTAKLGAAWTATLMPKVDMTLNAAVGHGFAQGGVDADFRFATAATGEAEDEDFAEYGVRLGFKPTPAVKADLFIQGVAGRLSATQTYVGGALGLQF